MWGMVPSSIQLWLSIGTRGPDDPEPSPQASSVTLRLLFGKLRIDMPHQAGCVRRCIPSCYSHVNSENHEKPMDFGTGLCSDNPKYWDDSRCRSGWCCLMSCLRWRLELKWPPGPCRTMSLSKLLAAIFRHLISSSWMRKSNGIRNISPSSFPIIQKHRYMIYEYTLWLFNIAMGNGPEE